jgi:tripartite ATP-independent transporter DctP family solute receptor
MNFPSSSAKRAPLHDAERIVTSLSAGFCSGGKGETMSNWPRRLAQYLAILAAAFVVTGPAQAQTKLKWAHVYEVAEPYHANALWAADEIKKRTDGRYEIGVFPASQLGNENQINEGLGLGTVDIIYTGASFAGSIHKPLAITGAPFILRDFDHWKAYRDSQLFRDLAKGYDDKTRHKVVAILYYGQRHVTANKEIKKPEDMKGMKLRVPPAPLFLMFTKSVGANATPIAFAEVYLALQQGTVDGQENPLPTIMAKKFYEVQSHIMLTGHITESLVTIVGGHVWSKLSDADKKVFDEVLKEASARSTDQIRASELKLADEFRKLGKNVVEVDREAFRKAAVPLHNDASAGAGWSKAEYDALQALK